MANKETLTVGTRNCNKETQLDLQPKNVLIKDPGIEKLQEDLAQAQRAREKLE